MPIPLHLRRQIGASRVASHSIAAPPPVEPVPVVDVPKAKPEPSFTINPWVRQAKVAAAAVETPAVETPAVEEPAPAVEEPAGEAPAEPTAEPDFSGLKSTSLKADLLAYTAYYGLPVDDTNTKAEIWAAIEAHKATLAG